MSSVHFRLHVRALARVQLFLPMRPSIAASRRPLVPYGDSQACGHPAAASKAADVTVGFLSARHDRVAPATHALPAACHARDHAHNATVLAIQLPIPPRGRARMVFGTGFMMESLANALHQAACCAGVAILPNLRRPERRCTERMACHATLHALLGPRPQVCFDFRHLSRVAMSDALCSSRSQGGLHGEVFPFFWPATACPTPVFHGRLALRTLLWYANLDAALPCPPLHYEQTLVAHIRGGDVWMSSDAAPDYAQSPLAFYLASWRISGLPRLLVVSEDDASPLVKVATLLQRTLPAGGSIDVRTGGRWRDDLAVLRCARHLAVARSSIRQVLLSSSRVRSVYVAASSATGVGWEHPLEDAWLGSCKASVWLAEEELRGPGPQVRWAASVAQALESVLTDGMGLTASGGCKRAAWGCRWNAGAVSGAKCGVVTCCMLWRSDKEKDAHKVPHKEKEALEW
eukprot:CAMPEP_0119360178 /NCGR_PEP_ID=MMETSP1334-20130426/7865_1 /TAXON_ID=127549 /ORGANISM="Calcidiscus leptoporus, Strain RCC1130" /LENGTH=459 /DNA_ID=CAMNT_0007374979 /DNA_START=225 /DNA_END=1603 /DNA_ORIENTATION=+